jgi:16S rRNA (adenine1518-N6/adenine1519-N6)-dimethyltransferase
MPAKPKLGQNFLNDPQAGERIVAALGDLSGRTVVEVGPGGGAITGALAARAARVIAVELDRDLAVQLRARFPLDKVTVVEQDVLHFNFAEAAAAAGERLSVVGNLPYYITSPILDRVLALGPLLRRAVFLVQREVAERLTAPPGGRDYGFLSVRTQFFAHPRILFGVPRSAFQPPPKVDSAVVLLDPHPPALADSQDFLAFVGHCFKQKRKTLRNNLAALYPRIAECPEASLRAEQLSLDQFVDLYRRLAPTSPLPAFPSRA